MAYRINDPEKGNMYEFITRMYSPVRGKCKHDCSYCYMKRFPLNEMHLDEKDLRIDLGTEQTVFVGYTIDLFADDVPVEWIEKVLAHLCRYPDNRYLLQSKNPERFINFVGQYPPDVFFGTTIETNRTEYYESKAPVYSERAKWLGEMSAMGFETMVTIEPIFDFDVDELVELVKTANPKWVNIGADSKGHTLPEPSADKVRDLVGILKEKTKIELKRNLDRIVADLE